MADEEQPDHPVFKQATVKELLRLSHEPNTRINPFRSSSVSAAATHLSAEYLRLFATEAIHRAAEVAEKEREASKEAGKAGPPGMLETKHLEQILAGLLLDFS